MVNDVLDINVTRARFYTWQRKSYVNDRRRSKCNVFGLRLRLCLTTDIKMELQAVYMHTFHTKLHFAVFDPYTERYFS